MLGEGLICVWQAAFARTIEKERDIDFADDLKCITKQVFSALSDKTFSEKEFACIIKHGYASFQDFKAYIMKNLQDDDVPDYLQIAAIEEECWKLSKGAYKSNIPEKSLKKLWQIANRLTLANSYPPVICKKELELLSKKAVDYLSHEGSAAFLCDHATFPQLLVHLEETLFSGSSEEKIVTFVDDLHCWLVWEVSRTGWIYKRSKSGSNWTTWVKRWCALLPERLLFFEKECPTMDELPTSEFMLTKATKVECPGAESKLGKRFKLSNLPFAECDIVTKEPRAWISKIQQLIQNPATPVQNLLLERYRLREDYKRKTKENTDNLYKYLRTNNDSEGFDSGEDTIYRIFEDKAAEEEAKMKAMFMKFDSDGNGLIDKPEFEKFVKDLGLQIKDTELNLIFNQIDKSSNGLIDFNEFCQYFSEQVLDEHAASEDVNAIRGAFLAADQDGSGTINFKEFSDYMWEKKRDIRMNYLLKAFGKFETSGDGELSFLEFRKYMEKEESVEIRRKTSKKQMQEPKGISAFEMQLRRSFDATESDELAKFLNDRWKSFSAFKRRTNGGSIVMTGGEEMVSDVLPGNYSLVDLVCFSDLPPLEPKHTVIKGVKWVSSKVPGKSGQAIFPSSFDGKIVTEIATNEHLRYYGASHNTPPDRISSSGETYSLCSTGDHSQQRLSDRHMENDAVGRGCYRPRAHV